MSPEPVKSISCFPPVSSRRSILSSHTTLSGSPISRRSKTPRRKAMKDFRLHTLNDAFGPCEVEVAAKATFDCDEGGCSAKFKRQEHLKRHKRSVHQPDNVEPCELCGQAFTRRDNLKSHVKRHLVEPNKKGKRTETKVEAAAYLVRLSNSSPRKSSKIEELEPSPLIETKPSTIACL